MIGGTNTPYGKVRASEVESKVFDPTTLAIRYIEIPSNLQQRLDYGSRTDGQPDYMGFAEKGLGISASGWLLQEFTYDASGKMTLRQISFDSWDDRALTTFEQE